MKISLKNKIIGINFSVSKTPNLKNLKKELADFFSQNEIEGFAIKKFRIDEDSIGYSIIPEEPCFEEMFSGGDYTEKIEGIGKKYGIKHFGFVYWCYHK